ncbi:MAG: DNA-directed RNA polymerase subunit alpha [Chloroflexi bacterium CFX6]|nr:DNA-directed RNA polymerase subunit alpha [Chloroflexi bacterium CFX6]
MDNNTLEQTRIEVERATERYAKILISPLEGGSGTTLGNALRRVLLSSLGGVAITSIKLADVYHEFSVIPNVREDTTRLLLNLKQVRFKPLDLNGSQEWRVGLIANGEGLVTAADLHLPPDLEVMNPEQPILTLDSHDADIQMELMVRRGRGYSPADERGKLAIGELPVDAIFSPIRRVAFSVSKTRVGRLSDHDGLTMEIWTDGSVAPQEALAQAAAILTEKFRFIAGLGSQVVEATEPEGDGIPTPVYETAIEELDLSVRAYNCLKRAGLTRVGEILERMAQGDEEMLVIRNFGQKSLDELKDALVAKGFGDYMPRFD